MCLTRTRQRERERERDREGKIYMYIYIERERDRERERERYHPSDAPAAHLTGDHTFTTRVALVLYARPTCGSVYACLWSEARLALGHPVGRAAIAEIGNH